MEGTSEIKNEVTNEVINEVKNEPISANLLSLFLLMNVTLSIGLYFILNNSSRLDVIAHWSEKRCDFDVLMGSFMYKPDTDSRSSFEFASENFKFCVASKTRDYLKTMFGSLYEVLKKQMASADIMTNVMKVLRAQLATIYQPFSRLMGNFWVKFKQIGFEASKTFQHLYMAMKKAGGSAVASIFIALSLQVAFMNTIDFVIKVIMIVLYILMGLLFVFFLPILPLLVIVLMTVSGIETAMPGSTGPMGSVFCFHKNTRVIMSNLTEEHISNLKPGDILKGNNLVQAIIEVPTEELYDLDGVLVSGYHCIYHNNDVIYVKDHPRAIKTSEKENTLWTLITHKREIPVMGSKGPLRFLDWDEIPDSKEAEKAWDRVVNALLNKYYLTRSIPPMSAPCLDRTIKVFIHQGGWRYLREVKIGDWIQSNESRMWTQVKGICERTVSGGIGSDGSRMSDGNWILDSRDIWRHPEGQVDSKPWTGLQLITDSGSFKIQLNSRKEMVVRDFTEVGSNLILESHARVEKLLD
jgi:hypothetical protein